MHRILLITFIFLLCVVTSIAQKNRINILIDSILIISNDTSKINLMLEIAIEMRNNEMADSALFYASKADTLARKINSKKHLIKSLDAQGVILRKKGENILALAKHTEAYKLAQTLSDKWLLVSSLNNIGIAYRRLDKNDLALDFHQKALIIAEEINDEKNIAIASNSIGVIYNIYKNTKQSISYFNRALEIEQQRNNKNGIAINLAAIGWNYEIDKNYDKALEYYRQSLNVNAEARNKRGVAIMRTDIGNVLFQQGKYDEALENYENSIITFTNIDDKQHIAYTLLYKGKVLFAQKKYEKAQETLDKVIKISRTINSMSIEKDATALLSKVYQQKGNIDKAFELFKQADELEDSLFTLKSQDKLMELKTRFETEKTEKENEILRKDKLINQQTLEKRTHQMIAAILVLIILIFIGIYIIRNRNRLKKAHSELKKLNDELKVKNAEIETQSNILLSKNNLINAKNSSITNSIKYAKRIQNALLPDENVLQNSLTEYFIMFKPRDIVSGDFYWMQNVKNFTMLATADCTGHGVPGAFMSMLEISFLNEIVRRTEITQANQVLELLRNQIKTTLDQTGKYLETKDGMDIAFYVINNETLEMEFAGAYNSLFIIRQNQFFEVKGDRQPIGIYTREKPFTNHKFQLKKNDIIYSYTDGYIDQFGGEGNRSKFLSRHLKQLLLNIHSEDMKTQKQILEQTFDKWMGNNEQLDDVLVMGVRI